MGGSLNGRIRTILGGVFFREPIVMSNIPRLIRSWSKPIVIGRHAHGDQYRASDFVVPRPGTVMISYIPDDGSQPLEIERAKFTGGGAAVAMYKLYASLREFARATMR